MLERNKLLKISITTYVFYRRFNVNNRFQSNLINIRQDCKINTTVSSSKDHFQDIL